MLSFPSQLLCCKESFCLLCSPARGQDRVEDMHVHLLCINDHFTVTGSLAAHQLYWFFICSSSLHFIARRHALSQLALFRVTLVSLTLFPGDYASYSVLNTSPRDKVSSQRFEEDWGVRNCCQSMVWFICRNLYKSGLACLDEAVWICRQAFFSATTASPFF